MIIKDLMRRDDQVVFQGSRLDLEKIIKEEITRREKEGEEIDHEIIIGILSNETEWGILTDLKFINFNLFGDACKLQLIEDNGTDWDI